MLRWGWGPAARSVSHSRLQTKPNKFRLKHGCTYMSNFLESYSIRIHENGKKVGRQVQNSLINISADWWAEGQPTSTFFSNSFCCKKYDLPLLVVLLLLYVLYKRKHRHGCSPSGNAATPPPSHLLAHLRKKMAQRPALPTNYWSKLRLKKVERIKK